MANEGVIMVCMATKGAKNKPTGVRLEPELQQRLNDWINAQAAPPSISTVIKAALTEFLENHAPPPSRDKKR